MIVGASDQGLGMEVPPTRVPNRSSQRKEQNHQGSIALLYFAFSSAHFVARLGNDTKAVSLRLRSQHDFSSLMCRQWPEISPVTGGRLFVSLSLSVSR